MRLRLNPRLYHIQRVAADPARHSGDPSGENHRPERLLPAPPAPRVELLPHVLVRPEVHAVRRRVAQHGHAQAGVDSSQAACSVHALHDVVWASVSGVVNIVVSLELETDLDELHWAENEALYGSGADSAESHGPVRRRIVPSGAGVE